MFTALIEKLVRHEDLTADEAATAMQHVMDGAVSRRHSPDCCRRWR